MTAEHKSGISNGLDRKPWKISPKTPVTVLRESRTIGIYGVMTSDINGNARELAPDVDWSEVLWARACDARGKGYTVNSLTEEKFVRSFRPVAEQLGWGMSAPEVVYIGGLHFISAMDKVNADRERTLREALKESDDPNRKFVPEIRQASIDRTKEAIQRFEGFKESIEDALRRYAGQKLTPGWRNYVKELQKLFNFLVSGKEDEISGVVSSLSLHPPREARINKKWRKRKAGTELAQEPVIEEKPLVDEKETPEGRVIFQAPQPRLVLQPS